MYFEKFPSTFYSLDNLATVQLVTNITLRNVVNEKIKNNYSILDEYDIRDGDTPEIVADKVYNNPNYHWIILHINDIIDARFDWPLIQPRLENYVVDKYGNLNAVDHYEDSNDRTVSANILITTSSLPSLIISQNDVLVNLSEDGQGYVEYAASLNNYYVKTTRGGFRQGNKIAKYGNNLSNVTILSTTINNDATAVTVYNVEEALNDSRRRIKILKPQFIESFVNEFYSKLESLNG